MNGEAIPVESNWLVSWLAISCRVDASRNSRKSTNNLSCSVSQTNHRALELRRGWGPKSILLTEGARWQKGTFIKINLAQRFETHLRSLKPRLSIRFMVSTAIISRSDRESLASKVSSI